MTEHSMNKHSMNDTKKTDSTLNVFNLFSIELGGPFHWNGGCVYSNQTGKPEKTVDELTMNIVDMSSFETLPKNTTTLSLKQSPGKSSITYLIVKSGGDIIYSDRRKYFKFSETSQNNHIYDYVENIDFNELEDDNVYWIHGSEVYNNGSILKKNTILSIHNIFTGEEKNVNYSNDYMLTKEGIGSYFMNNMDVKSVIWKDNNGVNLFNMCYNPYWENFVKEKEMMVTLMYIYYKQEFASFPEKLTAFVKDNETFQKFIDVSDKLNNDRVIGITNQHNITRKNKYLRSVVSEYSDISQEYEVLIFWKLINDKKTLDTVVNKVHSVYMSVIVGSIIHKRDGDNIPNADINYFVNKVKKDFHRRKKLNKSGKTTTTPYDVKNVMLYHYPEWFLKHIVV